MDPLRERERGFEQETLLGCYLEMVFSKKLPSSGTRTRRLSNPFSTILRAALSALTRDHPETGRGWIMRSIRGA